jgi:hypothetical protein
MLKARYEEDLKLLDEIEKTAGDVTFDLNAVIVGVLQSFSTKGMIWLTLEAIEQMRIGDLARGAPVKPQALRCFDEEYREATTAQGMSRKDQLTMPLQGTGLLVPGANSKGRPSSFSSFKVPKHEAVANKGHRARDEGRRFYHPFSRKASPPRGHHDFRDKHHSDHRDYGSGHGRYRGPSGGKRVGWRREEDRRKY